MSDSAVTRQMRAARHPASLPGAPFADAFEAALEKGEVHRVVKPDNVKVREDRTVKVLDFGPATAVQSSELEPGEAQTLLRSRWVRQAAV
jgi:serine/threonine protein kinase